VALDDRYANKFAPLDSTTIYPKLGHALLYTTVTEPTNYKSTSTKTSAETLKFLNLSPYNLGSQSKP
jgi:hypothetical protein